MPENHASLEDLLDSVSIEQPVEVDLRRLLELNGNTRRGKSVVASINAALRHRGYIVEPELERADYWGTVTISDRRTSSRSNHQVGLPVSNIAQDAPELTAVGPDDTLELVETLMLMSDFSQVPVMDKTRRKLHGTVTWKSIARSRASGHVDAKAKDVMTTGGHVAESADNLMDLVPTILASDFIYFRNRENIIVGIVTSTDLAATFQNSTGLFVRIGEIESLLRLILDQLPLPELESSLDESIVREDFGGASDMTFGEYIRVLENPKHWATLALGLDRKTCVASLKRVLDLRNDIMHFRTRAEDTDSETMVLGCLNWLTAASKARL
ncbi:CBS domain-containing protein [Microbacterium sp. NPDC057658]|uniref:CBS domain-containing protein n=1 Tax=unclassified Microbacterium TaxID=2609290 RepID=UPI00367098FF